MIINNINIFSIFATSENFGINKDIYETNILNLAVVVGTLVYYGRIALRDIIEKRKQNIVKNLQELENKIRESEEVLTLAKSNLEIAISKAEQIRQQGIDLSIETSESILSAMQNDIKRLKDVNILTIKMREKKSLNAICQKLRLRAFRKATETINKRLNTKFHKKIISKKIDKLSKKKLKTK